MKLSLKKLAGATVLTLIASSAFAEAFYLDVGANFSNFGTKAAGPNSTGAFNEMNIRYNSTTIITDTNGDRIFNTGDQVVGSGGLDKVPGPAGLTNSGLVNRVTNLTPAASIFNPAGPALNGFPNNWLLTFGWNNLTGTVNASGGINYTGGLIHVYLVDPVIFGNNLTHEILRLNVTSGGTNAIGQSLNLTGTVDVLAGLGQNVMHWASDNSTWFNSPVTIHFDSNQNTEPFYVNGALASVLNPLNFYATPGGTGYLEGEHDGSMAFHRIPEPGSMALLGAALIGLGALRRRRLPV